jgi:ABC-type nitrate/sulfonate/bicarbonate transport system permease component
MTLPHIRRKVALAMLGVALVLVLWQLIVSGYRLERIVLPPPLEVVTTLIGLVVTRAFWHDIGVSLFEFTAGYALGVVAGIVVGTLMGESRRFHNAATPVIESFRFIVPFAWIPLTILWFGTSYWGKILLVAYAVFFVMVVSTARAIAAIDPVLSRVGTMLGMRRRTLALNVHLPAAAPTIASAARVAAAIGWIAVVAAEYVGASAGLGVMITNAATSLATSVVIAGMLVIGAIGAAVSALVGAFAHARWSTA